MFSRAIGTLALTKIGFGDVQTARSALSTATADSMDWPITWQRHPHSLCRGPLASAWAHVAPGRRL